MTFSNHSSKSQNMFSSMSLCIARVYKYEKYNSHCLKFDKIMGIWQGNSSQFFGLKQLSFCSIESIFEEDTRFLLSTNVFHNYSSKIHMLKQRSCWSGTDPAFYTWPTSEIVTLVKQTFKWVETWPLNNVTQKFITREICYEVSGI